MAQDSADDLSVLVLASDLGIDARPLLSRSDPEAGGEQGHDYATGLAPAAGEGDDGDGFWDLEALQVLRVEGSDRAGNRILRIVGKFFPAPVIDGQRLKNYVYRKLSRELPDGPFCIVYMHSTVKSDDNNPGMLVLRRIYEDLPSDYKERLKVVYFLHPGLRSRLTLMTLGRLMLSGGLYWKIKYVSRVEFLWEDIRKGEVEIPDFVNEHDKVLEQRPLTDYGIEPDPFRLTEVPAMGSSFALYENRWYGDRSTNY